MTERLLRRNPDERYQTAEDVLADLTALRDRIAAPAQPAALPAPSGSPRTARHKLLLGAVAVLGVIVMALGVARWRESSGAPATARTSPGLAGRTTVMSVAVLPLKNYSSPDQEYFADGMTEELTTTLAKIEALRVVAHQSVAQFKRSDRTVPEIARLLDVNYVVDGSLRQTDDRVRITASLIDVARNSAVWSDAFDGNRRDVMELQRQVALAIAQVIRVTLTPQDSTRLAPAQAVNPEAFELYIKGTQARYAANFSGDFRDAIRYLSDAIAKDSAYAPAYAGLSLVQSFVGDDTRARALADKALVLDPSLTESHLAQGLFYDWDWPGTERAFRAAIDMNPGHAEAHHELSMALMRLKRFDEALREAQLSLSLAPTSIRFLNGIGEVEAYSGRPNEALATADQIIAIDSTFAGAYYIKGITFEYLGRLQDAEKAWRDCVRVAPIGCGYGRGTLGYIYATTGRRAQALKVLDTLNAELRDATGNAALGKAVDIATVHVGLGNRAEALTFLERAVKGHHQMLYLGLEPRFQALLKRVGLPAS